MRTRNPEEILGMLGVVRAMILEYQGWRPVHRRTRRPYKAVKWVLKVESGIGIVKAT